MKGFWRAQTAVFRLLLAALSLIFAFPAQGQSVDSLAKPTDYVSDFAHVLSPDAIAKLDSLCAQLDHSTANSQIAIVTVQTMNGDDAADYANQLEDKWKMGKKGTDKGVLVLLAVDDHKYRIDVGYGLEGILTDGKLGDIGRGMIPYLRANDYDSAITLPWAQMAEVIAADAHVTLTNDPMPEEQPEPVGTAQPGSGQADSADFPADFLWRGSIFRMLLGYGLMSSIFGGGGRGWRRRRWRRLWRRRRWWWRVWRIWRRWVWWRRGWGKLVVVQLQLLQRCGMRPDVRDRG